MPGALRRTLARLAAPLLATMSGCGLLVGVGDVPPFVEGGSDSPATDAGSFPGTYVHVAGAPRVDILFDIDNSSSMGDKQALLAQAIPEMVTRLIQPNCVRDGSPTQVVQKSTNGTCPQGSMLEFPPVHDMHIGVISSSLGSRGVTGSGRVCDPTEPSLGTTPPFPDGKTLPSHVDDRAELLSRVSTTPYSEGVSAATGGQGFLHWFPRGENGGKSPTNGPEALSPLATPLGSASPLETDFADLIIGAHYYGCGIESQLESWYRFLVQPDPYESIVLDVEHHAQWSGVDATIIKQRHDFLRPDSLVAIVDLTDENDSEIDVRSFGGQAYKFMDQNFQVPRGTSICANNPSSPLCTSCAYGGATAKDSACKMGPYTNADDPGFYINVRHVHMMQKYGIDPQFPLGRYVLGLTSPKVPDRTHEYPSGALSYQGGTVYDTRTSSPTLKDPTDLSCTNPLFAATLPDGSDLSPPTLCNAEGAGGSRTPSQIFYLHIGGVPHELLQGNLADGTCPSGTAPADCPQKDTLLPTDWQKILGSGWTMPPSPATMTNPGQYRYDGMDPHMVESSEPRRGVKTLTHGPKPTGGGGDPINGGEWVTDGLSPPHTLPVDREYACIFSLVDPRTGAPTPRDCTSTDYAVQEACDCTVAGLAVNAVPAVCGTQSGGPFVSGKNEYTKQYYAKAYPTIREIELVELMGAQGILSSLCPIHASYAGDENDPLFGYRPAMTSMINRFKTALGPSCVPRLPFSSAGFAECTVLTILPRTTKAEATRLCQGAGLEPAPHSVLSAFEAKLHADWVGLGSNGPDESKAAICEVRQLQVGTTGTCESGSEGDGFCYLTGTRAGACEQTVAFSPGVPPAGALVWVQCP